MDTTNGPLSGGAIAACRRYSLLLIALLIVQVFGHAASIRESRHRDSEEVFQHHFANWAAVRAVADAALVTEGGVDAEAMWRELRKFRSRGLAEDETHRIRVRSDSTPGFQVELSRRGEQDGWEFALRDYKGYLQVVIEGANVSGLVRLADSLPSNTSEERADHWQKLLGDELRDRENLLEGPCRVLDVRLRDDPMQLLRDIDAVRESEPMVVPMIEAVLPRLVGVWFVAGLSVLLVIAMHGAVQQRGAEESDEMWVALDARGGLPRLLAWGWRCVSAWGAVISALSVALSGILEFGRPAGVFEHRGWWIGVVVLGVIGGVEGWAVAGALREERGRRKRAVTDHP